MRPSDITARIPRKPTGTVHIGVKDDRLRLRLPRTLFDGKERYL
ncbi:MAG TPA: hypothetical protein V6C84_13075 [Coleofasciculaceae cyanobacterium]